MPSRAGRASASRTAWARFTDRLFEPVDGASLVFARVAFGVLMAWESYEKLAAGGVTLKWIDPRTLVPYPGFEWVPRLSADAIHVLFYVLALCGVCIAAGFLRRVAAFVHGLIWTYLIVIAAAFFNNHYYLIALLSFLFALVPVDGMRSVRARLRPQLRCETVPTWSLWLMRFQLGVVYAWGGVAKLQADWLQGYPMRIWLPAIGKLPVVGELFQQGWVAVAMSWSGMLLDLFAVPALLWRRTRPFAFVALVSFHLWNSRLFTIGVFPWLAIALTTLYLDPAWPRRVFNWPRQAAAEGGRAMREGLARQALVGVLVVYVSVQALWPVRHYFHASDPSWTGEGHSFSWRMMLRQTRGFVGFVLTDLDTEESWLVEPEEDLGFLQYRRLSADVAMMHTYAKHLATLAREDGHERLSIRAVGVASLNGREPEPIVDPTVDLLTARLPLLGSARWTFPVTKPVGVDWISDDARLPPEQIDEWSFE